MRRNKEGKKRPTVGGVLFLLVFVGLGIYMIYGGFRSAERYETLSTRCTESTTGTVTAIRTEKVEKEDKDGYPYYEEYNIVTVTYFVHNEPYTVRMKDTSQIYERDDEMEVWYAPDEPGVSYLDANEPSNNQIFLTLLALFCIGMGVLVFLMF